PASTTPSRPRPCTSSAEYSNAAMVLQLLAGDAHGFLERGVAAQDGCPRGVAEAWAGAGEGRAGQRVLVGAGADQVADAFVDFQCLVDGQAACVPGMAAPRAAGGAVEQGVGRMPCAATVHGAGVAVDAVSERLQGGAEGFA